MKSGGRWQVAGGTVVGGTVAGGTVAGGTVAGGRWHCGRWQVLGGTATVAGGRYIFCQALFMKILKVPGKLRKQITLCCQALFYENIKSAWQSAEANYTLLPGTFFMKILKVPGKVRKQITPCCQALFI